MKDSLNEIKSLMKRMEDVPNGGSGYLMESLDEGAYKERTVVDENSFYDLLSSLRQGTRVTFGYLGAAKIEVPKGKRLNPSTNRMNSFDDYEALGKNLGETGKVLNVIKLTIYNLPWQNEDVLNKQYSNWKQKRNELGQKFGVEFGKARYGTQTNNFGSGVNQYNGDNDALKSHTYSNFNMSGVKPISTTYYLVMDSGELKPIDVNKLTLLPYKQSQSEIDKLIAAGATEQDVEPLKNMQYRRFEHSHVLFVSATPKDGVATLLINNKLPEKLGSVENVNPDEIIKLAKERYSKVMN